MICYQGEYVTPENDEVPNLFSMGVHLGRINRFGGAASDIYSVLQHTLVVMALLPDEYAIHGLFHDVPEMCCSDVPTPWKTKAAEAQEAQLLSRIYKAYGLPSLTKEAARLVHEADIKARIAEAFVLNHPGAMKIANGVEPDELALDLTSKMVENTQRFQIADIAGDVFEQAYAACLVAHGVSA